MRLAKITGTLILLAFAFSCTERITSPHYMNQFPLRVGMFWEYESTDIRITQEILSIETIYSGKKAYKLRTESAPINNSADGANWINYTYLIFEEDELREYDQPECPQDFTRRLVFPLENGATWAVYAGVACDWVDPNGDSVKVVRLGGNFNVLYSDVVNTPAGRFEDCWVIDQEAFFPGSGIIDQTLWFKPYVGFVKYRHYIGGVLKKDYNLTKYGMRRKLEITVPNVLLSPAPAHPSKAGE